MNETIYYCPPNVTLKQPWVKHGLTRCFLDTISTSIVSGFLILFGFIAILVYKKYGIPIQQPRSCRRSYLFKIQIVVSLVLALLPLLEFFVQSRLNGDPLYGSLILNVVGNVIAWPLSLYLVHLERINLLPSMLNRRRHVFAAGRRHHGMILLTFWTIAFAAQILTFLNMRNQHWWFSDLKTTSEFSFFLVRFLLTSIAFVLGLKAPGLYANTTDRPCNDGLVCEV